MPKKVEYKKEIPEGLVLGRNKPLPGVRVIVERFHYGRANTENSKQAASGVFEEMKKLFGDNALTDGFDGYKITTHTRN
jgi:uncharacterized protein YcnI